MCQSDASAAHLSFKPRGAVAVAKASNGRGEWPYGITNSIPALILSGSDSLSLLAAKIFMY